jgi:predicted XRE-type DNA-binding protein
MSVAARNRLKPGDKGTIGGIEFERGSGNVFRDLGLPDPEMRLAKSILAHRINDKINASGWSQKRTAEAFGTSQPTVSLLKQGMLKSITYDRLITWLVILNQNVTITVSPAAKKAHVEVEVVSRTPGFAPSMNIYERPARKYRQR